MQTFYEPFNVLYPFSKTANTVATSLVTDDIRLAAMSNVVDIRKMFNQKHDTLEIVFYTGVAANNEIFKAELFGARWPAGAKKKEDALNAEMRLVATLTCTIGNARCLHDPATGSLISAGKYVDTIAIATSWGSTNVVAVTATDSVASLIVDTRGYNYFALRPFKDGSSTIDVATDYIGAAVSMFTKS